MQTTHAHRISRQLKALADVNRIRILATLVEGECCVSELVKALDIDQPKVSHHLAILRSAGHLEYRIGFEVKAGETTRRTCELVESRRFNSVLTPNYNDGHRNHFHIDIRPADDRVFVR